MADRALQIGAIKALTVDARRDFLEYFVWPALQAGALYEGEYPLATALARPLIAKLLVDAARAGGRRRRGPRLHRQGQRPGALRRLVPGAGAGPEDHRPGARVEHDPRRRDRVRRASTTSPSTATAASPYSVDANLWGRSVEAASSKTRGTSRPQTSTTGPPIRATAPDEPAEITIAFEQGVPVALRRRDSSMP